MVKVGYSKSMVSMHLSVCLFACPPIHLFACPPSIHSFITIPTYLPTHPPIYTYLPTYLICPPIHTYLYTYILLTYLPTFLPTYLKSNTSQKFLVITTESQLLLVPELQLFEKKMISTKKMTLFSECDV